MTNTIIKEDRQPVQQESRLPEPPEVELNSLQRSRPGVQLRQSAAGSLNPPPTNYINQYHVAAAVQRIQSGRSYAVQMQEDILTLQRTIGNRAVVQLLEEQRRQTAEKKAPPAKQSMTSDDIHAVAQSGIKNTGKAFKSDADYHKVQTKFGENNVAEVQLHTDTAAQAACEAIGAEAYTTSDNASGKTHVAFRRSNPSLSLKTHELTHATQQQGEELSLKDGIGAVGDPYERQADAVAEAVTHDRPVGNLLNTSSSGGAKTSPHVQSKSVVQMGIGLEAEVHRAVVDGDNADQKYHDETDLLNHAHFKLVTDKYKGTSNMEFVMNHFDQHLNNTNPINELTTRLDSIKTLYDTLYYGGVNRERLGDTGAGGLLNAAPVGYTVLRPNARVAPDITVNEDNQLYIHYTIGVAPENLFKMMNFVSTFSRDGGKGKAQTNAAHSITVANVVAAKGYVTRAGLSHIELEELKGYLAMVYTQIAAFSQDVRGPWTGGQVKNKAAVLARERLRRIYDILHPNVQGILYTNYDDILDEFDTQIKTIGGGAAFNDADYKQIPRIPGGKIKLIDYAKSAFGREASVSQQRVFGLTNEVGIDASVPSVLGVGGIPFEIRSLFNARVDWPTLRANAERLLDFSLEIGDNPSYLAGLTAAQAGAVLGGQPSAYTTAALRYQKGLQHAKANTILPNQGPAYDAAVAEYALGMAHVQGGVAAANAHAAYVAGRTEYGHGLTDARAGTPAASPNVAYMASHNEYGHGLTDARAGTPAASPNAAYMAGHNEYGQGLTHAQANTPAANAHVAYMAGRNEYGQGLAHAQTSTPAANAHVAYMAGFNEYNEGKNHGQRGKRRKKVATHAYTQGYTDHRI